MRKMRNPPHKYTKLIKTKTTPPLFEEIYTKKDRKQKNVQRYHLLKPRLSSSHC